MRATAIIVIGVTTFIFFGVLTYIMGWATNATIWAPMCNSDWETGLIEIVIPCSVLVFGGYLAYAVFKGKPDNNGGQQ